MKKSTYWFIGIIAVVAIALIALDVFQSRSNNQATTTSSQTSSQKSTSSKPVKKDGKTLIVFFSRSGSNYPNDNLKIGHTHQMANWIADKTGGTQYEVVPADPYPSSYNATVSRSEEEQSSNARPKIKNPLPNLDDYDTIFIGYPIWDGELPMIMRTFLDKENLNGKTVVPFSSNAGSAWGNTLDTIKKQYPKADMKKGFEVEGTEVDNSKDQIDSWLTNLGY